MADVQLEHGHLRLANALDEAITYAPFTGTQTKIVRVVVRLTYGWRRRTVRASYQDLALRCGIQKVTGAFRRELDELLRERVVLRVEAGHGRTAALYAINKNFEDWGRLSVPASTIGALYGERPPSEDELLSVPSQGQSTEDDFDGDSVPPEGQSTSIEGAPEGHTTDPEYALEGHSPRPRGSQSVPQGVIVTGSKSNENGDFRPPKDIERQLIQNNNSNRTAGDETGEQDYALRLTAAANGGIEKRWGEQPNPLNYGNSTQLAHDLVEMGVRLETATAAIAQVCATKKGEKPFGVEYFRNAIITAHRGDEQRDFERANPVRLSEERGGNPVPMSAMAIHQTYTPVAERSEFSVHQQYDAERAKASEAWASDPANVTQLTALMATAERENAFLGPKWIARAAAVAIGQAAGFPPFDAWRAAQSAA